MRLALFLGLMFFANTVFATSCTTPCVQFGVSTQQSGAGGSGTAAYAANQVAGHTNIVTVMFCNDGSCSTGPATGTIAISDTVNGSYPAAAVDNNTSVFRIATYVVPNIGSGANTVSVTVTGGSPNFLTIMISEYIAVTSSVVDQTGLTGGTTSTNPTASTSMSTMNANDIVYGAMAKFSTAATPGSGFTGLNALTTITVQDEFMAVSSTGTQTANWTAASTGWAANVVAIKQNTGPGSSSHTPFLLLGVGK